MPFVILTPKTKSGKEEGTGNGPGASFEALELPCPFAFKGVYHETRSR